MNRPPTPGTEHRMALGTFVAHRGEPRQLEAGETLFLQGERSSTVYACTEGRINLFVTSPSGREVILGTKTPVEGFGELSAISRSSRSATAQAMEPSVVHCLPGPAFLEALDGESSLALVVLRELVSHLMRANLRLSARSADTANVRVANLLLELGTKFERHAPGPAVELPVTQDEVAAWVGATREAAARSLALLRRAGAVETGRGRITIVDSGLLEDIAEGFVSL